MEAKRHLPYAVSTVVGLAAPALAALLLTSSTPGLAAVPAPTPAVVGDVEGKVPHAPVFAVAAPTAAPVAAPVAQRAPARPAARPTEVRTRTAPVSRPASTPAPKATRTTTTRTVAAETAQPRGTDDYPYRTQSDFYAVDRWGFTQRQCVSFAAWRLAQHGRTISNQDEWGSAYQWDEAARRLGKRVTSTPRVGAVAQWNAHESGAYYSAGSSKANGRFTAGGYGHVGWVKQVYSDGSVLVEQYNMGETRTYSVMRVKAPRYLLV